MRNGCRICGSDGFDLFLELDRAPTSIERLLDEDAVQGDHPIPLTVWRCQTCSHVQTRSDLEDTFYDDYYMLEDSEIEEDVALRRAMAESFQKLLPLRGKRIVDMGPMSRELSRAQRHFPRSARAGLNRRTAIWMKHRFRNLVVNLTD